MPVCTREDFLREYSFPLQPARDFEQAGVPAQHASGHPKEWSPGIDSFDFGSDLEGKAEGGHRGYHSAISPDQKLLAVSSSHERIGVYDIASKELRQVLEGTGKLVFRPMQKNYENASEDETKIDQFNPAYTLVSSLSDLAHRADPQKNKLILWELDRHGRLMDEEEPIDTAAFAAQAVGAILPDLEAKHEWSSEFISASNLLAEFDAALSKVAADHRRRWNTVLESARLGNFGSDSFSSDGKYLLYHYMDRTTQHGMREASKLPHVIVYDLDRNREVHRLSGHTDAIMWSGFSPDNQHIASISWDGTMRMYSASTAELSWVTENSGGQSWAGAFSPDSKHIVWSSNGGRIVQVHDVADARIVSRFPEKYSHWCRCLGWHPDGQQVAVCVDKSAFVWRPFDGPEGKIVQNFQLDDQGRFRRMASVQSVSWLDSGRSLCLEFSEGTRLVYNMQTNAKEVFKRPDGVETAWVDGGFYGIFGQEGDSDFYLSVDGDGKVRYWRTSVPAHPSWWDKEKNEDVETPKKAPFPETGKYVKITKTAKKEDKSGEKENKPDRKMREDWAQKGAELWTAE